MKNNNVIDPEWNDSLATSIEWQDEHHKELFELVDKIYYNYRKEESDTVLEDALNFLCSYIEKHFKLEEGYMVKYGYDHLEAHKREHDNFIADFEKLKNKFKEEGGSISLVLLIKHKLSLWLNEHIERLDIELGHFLHSFLQADEKDLKEEYKIRS